MTAPDPAFTPPGSPAHPDEDRAVLSVPVETPLPGPAVTEEDGRQTDPRTAGVADGAHEDDTDPNALGPGRERDLAGPPGGRIFSVEGRSAPGLYLAAWLLSLIGVGALFITLLAQPSAARTVFGLAGLICLGLGLSAGAGYQVLAREIRDPDAYHGPAPLLVFGVVLVVSSILSNLLAATGLVDAAAPLGFLASLLVIGLSYVLTVWVFVVRSGALSWPDMGWPTGPERGIRTILDTIGRAIAVMIPTTFAALLLGGLVGALLGVKAPEVLPTARTSAEALAVALAAVVVAPVGEELFFRGFSLTAWWRDLGPRTALVRSALFFAVVHIANINATSFGEGFAQAILQFAVILPLGLVLGWLFIRRGIVASIAGHITYNGILLALVALQAAAGNGAS